MGEVSQPPQQGRIPLCVRIGVTGHRILTDTERLTSEIAQVIERIVGLVPSDGRPDSEQLHVVAVSSLADGADRLVARAVLSYAGHGGSAKVSTGLEAVLPMPVPDYATTFVEAHASRSRQEFDALLAQSSSVHVVTEEVDLRDSAAVQQAYFDAGIEMLRRSDVVVAVWDGKRSKEHGGTSSVVSYARRHKIPLVWIKVDGKHRIEESPQEWDDFTLGALTPETVTCLNLYNSVTFDSGRFASAVHRTREQFAGRPGDADVLPIGEFLDWSAPYYVRADLLARRFQWRYLRSAEVLWGLAAAASAIAALQIIWSKRHPWIVAFELLALVAAIGILVVARISGFHERWIASRFLGERIRAATFLGMVGQTEQRSVRTERILLEEPADAWIRRAFGEVWERRPQWHIADSDVGPLQRYLAEAWVGQQVSYHRMTARRYRRSHSLLVAVSVALFGIGLLGGVGHLSLSYATAKPHVLGDGWAVKFSTSLSIIAPACGAAVTGYARQRDFLRHSLRYERMAGLLRDVRQDLLHADSIDGIRAAAGDTARLLREEAGDWFGVVRLHDLELPS